MRSGGGHTEVVEYLELVGANEVKRIRIAEQYEKSNRSTDKTEAFLKAAYDGDLTVVKLFVESGMSVNTAIDDVTALHVAAGGGHLAVVRYLVEQGADVNAEDGRGFTVEHRAVMGGHTEVRRYLLEQGAEKRLLDLRGKKKSN